MINNANKMKFFSLILFAVGFVLINGSSAEVHAQSGDPFAKPNWQKPPNPNAKVPTTTTAVGTDGKVKTVIVRPVPPPVVPIGAPAAQDRINYYLRIREEAANRGDVLPKLTSVLTLDEMSVTGIFRTPRGFAAIVQATPVNLAYTIYPGEKFFDGQLVAIEENKLVFRKVSKMSNGKFVSMEVNKPLRKYTDQEAIQGTVPTGESGRTEAAAVTPPATQTADGTPVAPTSFISPLDEMNRPQVETPKSATDKKDKKGKSNTAKSKKPVKVASNQKQ